MSPPAIPLLRADDKVEIQWARYVTHVTPEDPHDPKFKRDLERGILEMKWYEAEEICVRGCFGKIHCGWDGGEHYGGWARVCQERTGHHRCRFVSGVVPRELEGSAVTFAGAVAFDLRNGQSAPILLHVHGSRQESTVLTVGLEREWIRGEYDFHFKFYPLRLGLPWGGEPPDYEFVTGIAHITVFSSLLNYGGRMMFEFVAPTAFDPETHGMTIGRLDSTRADIAALQAANGVTDEELRRRRERVTAGAREKSRRINATLEALAAPARVTVDCSNVCGPFDRGERRVTLYPAWYGIGLPGENLRAFSEKLTRLVGPFDLFRYQGHIADYDWESGVFEMNASDRREWEILAGAAREVVFSGGPHHPFLTALKALPEADHPRVAREGVGAMTWERITDNFEKYVAVARGICPEFSILQMPYELDNLSETAVSMDIHYQFFRACYLAAHTINAKGGDRPLRVAGPSINTFNTGRWMRWMDGFLTRYAADPDPRKRLDFLAWHAYLFPPATPGQPRGKDAAIRGLLEKHGLDPETSVLIDEAGIAEFSVPDEYLDLEGFSRKQLASAAWLLALQAGFMREGRRFQPITGDGWHFGSLCIGRQAALTHRGKALILRTRMEKDLVASEVQPRTDEGYGLDSLAAIGDRRVTLLVWNCSPGMFMPGLPKARYPDAEIHFTNLPAVFRGESARLTIERLENESGAEAAVFASGKCRGLQKIDRQRHSIDFTPEEVAALDEIPSNAYDVWIAENGGCRTMLTMEEHGIYLLTLEAAPPCP